MNDSNLIKCHRGFRLGRNVIFLTARPGHGGAVPEMFVSGLRVL